MAADIGAKIKLDGGTEFERAIRNIVTASKQLSSELKLVDSQFSKNGTSTQALAAKAQVLSKQIEVQKQRITQMNTQLTEAQTKLQALGKAAEEAAAEFGENSVEAQKAAAAYDKQAATCDRLKTQINNAEVALNGMESELKQVQQQSSAFGQLSIKAEELGKKTEAAGQKLKGLSTAFAAVGGVSLKSAVDFESAFAGVTKTVDGTDAQLGKIRQGILDLSQATASTPGEIAAVAEAAGQLGIKTDNVMDFTKVMIELGDTTNLSAEQAASSLAKFANITNMSASDYSRLGSTIVDLGNNFATTESDIVEMGTRLASTGSLAGLSEPQIMALATAMSSVGIEAEAGGTAMSTLLKRIQTATETGGANLNKFASVAGVSADEFKTAFEQDAVGALSMFINGLNDTERNGQSAIGVLQDLGLTDARLSNTVLALAGSNDILGQAVDTANSAWNENTAMAAEAEKRYKTTAAQLSQMKSAFQEAAISMGEVMLPALRNIANAMKNVANFLAGLPEPVRAAIATFIMFGAALAPALIAIGKISLGVSAVSKALADNESGLSKFIASAKKAGSAAGTLAANMARVALNGIKMAASFVASTARVIANTASLVANKVATFAAANAQKILAIAMTAGKFLMVGAAIAAVGIGLYKFATNTDEAVAAVEGFSNKIVDMSNAFAQMAPQIAAAITNALPALLNAGVEIVNGLVNAITAALPALTAAIPQIVSTIVNGLVVALPALIAVGTQMLQTLIQAIASTLPSLMAAAGQIITTLVTAIATAVPALVEAAGTIVITLVQGIVAALPQLISGALQIIMALFNALIAALPQLISAGIQIIIALINGIVQAIPQLIAMIPQVINGIVTGITQNLPQIINGAIQIIMALIQGLIQAIPQLVAALPQIIRAIVTGLISMLGQIFTVGVQILQRLWSGISSWIGSLFGKVGSFARSLPGKIKSGIGSLISVGADWVRGLWNGIGSVKDWIIGKIKSFGSSVLDSLKSIFKIHSPSRATREIGVFVGEGFGIGFVESMRQVNTLVKRVMTNTMGQIESVGLTAQNSFEARIDYDRLEQMQNRGIYIDSRLIGRELKRQGVVFG